MRARVSQDENRTTHEPVPTPEATEGTEARPVPADAPTIGTGTSLALGCIAGTVLLILIGLLYILIAALL